MLRGSCSRKLTKKLRGTGSWSLCLSALRSIVIRPDRVSRVVQEDLCVVWIEVRAVIFLICHTLSLGPAPGSALGVWYFSIRVRFEAIRYVHHLHVLLQCWRWLDRRCSAVQHTDHKPRFVVLLQVGWTFLVSWLQSAVETEPLNRATSEYSWLVSIVAVRGSS